MSESGSLLDNSPSRDDANVRSRKVRPVDIGRVAIVLSFPERFIERRVEHVEMRSDHYYGVTILHQVQIPLHHSTSDDPVMALVPLGDFGKARLPDLEVRGPSGELLPILGRSERAYVLSSIFTAEWSGRYFRAYLNKDDGSSERTAAETILGIIQRAAASIVAEPEDTSYEIIKDLKSVLMKIVGDGHEASSPGLVTANESTNKPVDSSQIAWISPRNQDSADQDNFFIPADVVSTARDLVEDERFWDKLNRLATTTQPLAVFSGIPGSSYILTLSYSEAFAYDPVSRPGISNRLLHKFLVWLGIEASSIVRRTANANACESFYVMVALPEGSEAVRYFWFEEKGLKYQRQSLQPVESERAVLSAGASSSRKLVDTRAVLDVQIEPSPGVMTSVLLAVFLVFVGTYIYQRIPFLRATQNQKGSSASSDRGELLALAGLFSAAPAALAGSLAYRGKAFVRYLNRGPRFLVSCLAALAALLAAMVSLRDLDTGTEYVAIVTVGWSALTAGVLGFIQFGPRWRQGDRSRWQWMTRRLTARRCQQLQHWAAILFVVVLALAVTATVRIVTYTQHSRVFTNDFPDNVLRALRTVF